MEQMKSSMCVMFSTLDIFIKTKKKKKPVLKNGPVFTQYIMQTCV